MFDICFRVAAGEIIHKTGQNLLILGFLQGHVRNNYLGVSINGDTPIAGWFGRKNLTYKWMIWGYPPFEETSIYYILYIFIFIYIYNYNYIYIYMYQYVADTWSLCDT